jgi:hypothetical protein
MTNATGPAQGTYEPTIPTAPSDKSELDTGQASQVFDRRSIIIPLYLQRAYWLASASAVLLRRLLLHFASKPIPLIASISILIAIDSAVAIFWNWFHWSRLYYVCISLVGELANPILHLFSESTHIYRQELGIHFCLAFFLASEMNWWFFLHDSLKHPVHGGAAPWNVPLNNLWSPANWRKNREECLWIIPDLVLAHARCYTFSLVAALIVGTRLAEVSWTCWGMHSPFNITKNRTMGLFVQFCLLMRPIYAFTAWWCYRHLDMQTYSIQDTMTI